MTCPHCESTAIAEGPERPELGSRRFRCRVGTREFNARTAPPFNTTVVTP
jgi:hypothetical protein